MNLIFTSVINVQHNLGQITLWRPLSQLTSPGFLVFISFTHLEILKGTT